MKRYTKHNQPSREALQRKRDRADAERMSRPCPPRPIEHAPGEMLYRLVLQRPDGTPVSYVTLHAPARRRGARSRCDSFEVRDEWGSVVVERGGLHATARAAPGSIWPQLMSRAAVASLAP